MNASSLSMPPQLLAPPEAALIAGAPSARRSSLWWWILPLGMALALTLLIVGVTGFFRLSADAGSLRDSFTRGSTMPGAAWSKRIELSFGRFTCWVVRHGLSLVPLNPEARAAVQALGGAEVGVYQLPGRAVVAAAADILREADRAMEKRGWSRVVGMNQKHQLIAVYVPNAQTSTRNLQVCVAVRNERQLVIVSGRSNLEPLLQLAYSRPERLGRLPREIVPSLSSPKL